MVLMILELMIASVAGFIVHQFRRCTERLFSRGWLDLVHYAIGIVTVLPFALRIFKCVNRRSKLQRVDLVKELQDHFLVAYVLSFVSFGIGVVIGWVIDTLLDHRKVAV